MQIYLLEDNPYEAAYFTNCVADKKHQVTHFEGSAGLFDALRQHRPGLVVLDWMMPDITGLTALRRVRELYGSSLPVMMLTCMDRPDNIVDALESGADDYLIKPMSRPVLVARIEALLRRVHATPVAASLVLDRGPYRLDYRNQQLTINGEVIALTPKEFDLAWAVFSHPDNFIPKNDLITCVWGKRAEIAAHTFTQHVHVVRKKLRLQQHGYRIAAVYGAGYRLESPLEAASEAPPLHAGAQAAVAQLVA